MSEWAQAQFAAAERAGERLVLQPVTNLNSWTCGVAAHTGLRVQANPAFVDAYAPSRCSLMRWGVDSGLGTVIGTSDSGSELIVKWDSGEQGCNVRAGKQMDYWLMTVGAQKTST